MTKSSRHIDESIVSTVLRGTSLRAQPFRMVGRPRIPAAVAVDGTQISVGSLAPALSAKELEDAALAKALEAARDHGFREGWEQGHKEGLESGFQQGTAKAKQEVIEQAADVIAEAARAAAEQAAKQSLRALEQESLQRWGQHKARLDALLTSLPAQIAQRMEGVQDDLLALCMETLLKILGKEAVQASVVRSAVHQAIDQVRARPLVRVELHPDDLAALQSLAGWNDWCEQHASGMHWVSNEKIVSGGCVVISPEGSLDARLDSQLQVFRAMLLDSRQSAVNSRAGVPT